MTTTTTPAPKTLPQFFAAFTPKSGNIEDIHPSFQHAARMGLTASFQSFRRNYYLWRNRQASVAQAQVPATV